MQAWLIVTTGLLTAFAKVAASANMGKQSVMLESARMELARETSKRKALEQVVQHLKQQEYERILEDSTSNCTACYSDPCENGGTCRPQAPFNYSCDCPPTTTGNNCETVLQCITTGQNRTCGPGATCFVADHRLNCACPIGYSGDPLDQVNGCYLSQRTSCAYLDPNYSTLENLYYRYEGTCPYVLSQTCESVSIPTGYEPYKLRARNIMTYPHQYQTDPMEAFFEVYGQEIYIFQQKLYDPWTIRVNGIDRSTPFYFPNSQNWTFYITGTSYLQVITKEWLTVSVEHQRTCVYVPEVPAYQGQYTLCGAAGNMDNNTYDDLRFRNGTTLDVIGYQWIEDYQAAKVIDSWIDHDGYPNVAANCLTGEQVLNDTGNCDLTNSLCNPIGEAANRTGPFALCADMGPNTLRQAYGSCVGGLCSHMDICDLFTEFVEMCQIELPGTDLDNWRDVLGCPVNCPVHSKYASCASTCQATCAHPNFGLNSTCSGPCTEACECDEGYVIDNTYAYSQIDQVHCIPIEECGCTDDDGNSHPANQPWLTDNCTEWNTCSNGTYVHNPTHCDNYATCAIANGRAWCACEPGFTGDGFTCSDINECDDSTVCGQNLEHGYCTNTVGSYYCNCTSSFSGENCQNYTPTRHCADLYIFHGKRTDGFYKIFPPFTSVATVEPVSWGTEEPAHRIPVEESVTVYCKMEEDGGGFTLMSNPKGQSNQTFNWGDYVNGFGTNHEHWLGLEITHALSVAQPTSLFVELETYPNNDTATHVYPQIVVRDATTDYTIFIPQASCPTFGCEKWATWNLNRDGPRFYTADRDAPMGCSAFFKNRGWWFRPEDMCGQVNPQGVVQDPVNFDEYDTAYVRWSKLVFNAELWLRPQGYPNYDNTTPFPPTTIVTADPTAVEMGETTTVA